MIGTAKAMRQILLACGALNKRAIAIMDEQ
jgi:hypothetical protein